MELKMELVTETQAWLRHTEGVPGRGQGQEASEGRAGRRLQDYSTVAWGPGLPCPTLAVSKQIWRWVATRPLRRNDLSRFAVPGL